MTNTALPMVHSSICCLNSQYLSQNVVCRTTRTHLSSLLSPDLHGHVYHPICLTALNQVGASFVLFSMRICQKGFSHYCANHHILFHLCLTVSQVFSRGARVVGEFIRSSLNFIIVAIQDNIVINNDFKQLPILIKAEYIDFT